MNHWKLFFGYSQASSNSTVPIIRSSRSQLFFKIGFLKNFAEFIERHLCQSLFLNKITGLKPAILLKKKLWHRFFGVNFAKFFRTPFLKEHLRWLLLDYLFFTNFIEITLWHGCSSVNLLHIFRPPFPKNTSEGLLLSPL